MRSESGVWNPECGVWILEISIHHAPDSIHHTPISYTTLQKCYMKISKSVIGNAELCNKYVQICLPLKYSTIANLRAFDPQVRQDKGLLKVAWNCKRFYNAEIDKLSGQLSFFEVLDAIRVLHFFEANDQLDNWFVKMFEIMTAEMMQEPVEFDRFFEK